MFSRLANVFFNPPSSNAYFLDCIVVSPSHSVVALNRSFKFNFCSATLFSLFFWNGNFIFALFPILAFFCHLCATDMRCWNIPDVCIFICIYICIFICILFVFSFAFSFVFLFVFSFVFVTCATDMRCPSIVLVCINRRRMLVAVSQFSITWGQWNTHVLDVFTMSPIYHHF